MEITTAVAEALKSNKVAIAENALRKGATLAFAADITGLSIEEVQLIADNLGK